MNREFESRWPDNQLVEGEYLLWKGKPVTGRLFHLEDRIMIPFSIFWCGILVTILSGFEQTHGVHLVFLIPFIAMGFYMLFGRFIADQLEKRRTEYAITSNRILRKRGKTIDFLPYGKVPMVSHRVYRDGSGRISFGSDQLSFNPVFVHGRSFKSQRREPVFYLEDVPDVERVYRMIAKQLDINCLENK